MSESIESFWKEHEAVMTERSMVDTDNQSYWVIKEEEFFASHGLSSQHVKLIAGLGMCLTGFLMTVFLVYLCSKLTRYSQVLRTNNSLDNVEPIMMQGCEARHDMTCSSSSSMPPLPPPYDEVLRTDMKCLPTYWQASKGDALEARNA